LPWPWIDEEKAAPWIEKRSRLRLADSQRAAIRLALMAKALVIAGGPGVGKTTIVDSILKILAAKACDCCSAPTGRAAMHLKGYWVDHSLLLSGSANFSRSGKTRQDNDLVALRGASVCAGFDAKFDRAWGS
jgi:ATP-dependent exoDNAse (exonuclease V) alpha subunit